MSDKDKTVVIVGAGSTAAIAAKALAERKDVHVVDSIEQLDHIDELKKQEDERTFLLSCAHVDLGPDPICEDLRRDKHGKRGKKGKAKKDWMLNR